MLLEAGVRASAVERFSPVQTVWQGGGSSGGGGGSGNDRADATDAGGSASRDSVRRKVHNGRGAFLHRGTPGAMPCATTGNLFVEDDGRWRILGACEVARAMGWSEPPIRVIIDAARAYVSPSGQPAPLADSTVRRMLGGALAVGIVADVFAALAAVLDKEGVRR